MIKPCQHCVDPYECNEQEICFFEFINKTVVISDKNIDLEDDDKLELSDTDKEIKQTPFGVFIK